MINKKTKHILDGYIKRPTSTLLIIGDSHDGSEECIDYLLQGLLEDSLKNQRIELLPEEGKQIGVEAVRVFKQSLQTKMQAGSKPISRIAIVKKLHTATTEAQNALLKLLEEPVARTAILLQADTKEVLLDTIVSRCQTVSILPLSEQQVLELAHIYGKNSEDARRAYLLAGGASHLTELILKDQAEELTARLDSAKMFLKQTSFDRLKRMKEFDTVAGLGDLIDGLLTVSVAGLRHGSRGQVHKWAGVIRELRACKQLLQRNVLTKAVYLRLCVNL
ncbi:MAG TPA: hypothetical protein PKD20_03815 [Candidatus Saccharibacteria bacterium]|mgnify:CR=1 FL=1|jgi:DNA polymerase III delta prime subunit|nr:hypothetical protein [Candidatus Saccharibacteria bacterium]HMT55977.1 hypothetical protein [Candidatus Saccharibacteria bacterium]